MKRTSLPSISIGIPTYSGGLHLVKTLESVYKQTYIDKVDSIIVAVDGKKLHRNIIRRISHPKLKVRHYDHREGQSARINDLITSSGTDLLLLINDDVLLNDKTIEVILEEYKRTGADLMSAKVEPLPASSTIEHLLGIGADIRNEIIRSIGCNETYLSCNGRIIVLSKALYSRLELPRELWNNDAYIYCYAKLYGMRFHYINKVLCRYRDPKTLQEYYRQTTKYQRSFAENTYFLKNIGKYFYVPIYTRTNAFLKIFIGKPVVTLLYFAIYISVRMYKYFFNKKITICTRGYWYTDKSTKNLGYAK